MLMGPRKVNPWGQSKQLFHRVDEIPSLPPAPDHRINSGKYTATLVFYPFEHVFNPRILKVWFIPDHPIQTESRNSREPGTEGSIPRTTMQCTIYPPVGMGASESSDIIVKISPVLVTMMLFRPEMEYLSFRRLCVEVDKLVVVWQW